MHSGKQSSHLPCMGDLSPVKCEQTDPARKTDHNDKQTVNSSFNSLLQSASSTGSCACENPSSQPPVCLVNGKMYGLNGGIQSLKRPTKHTYVLDDDDFDKYFEPEEPVHQNGKTLDKLNSVNGHASSSSVPNSDPEPANRPTRTVHGGLPTTRPVMYFFTGFVGMIQAVLFVLIAMSDMALRRAMSHGARALRHTRAMFTTSTADEAAAATSVSGSSPTDIPAPADSADIKPFMDMPGPKGWPILGSFPEYFKKENQGQMHELMRRRHREFGKIFREQFGPRHNVAVADPNLMEEILRKEGKYPSRPPYESWVLYNNLRNRRGGLMTSEKEYWKRSRSTFATKFRPKALSEYMDSMNQVCTDLVDRISYLKDEKGGTHLVPGLLNELNKFTMETILSVMLNKRVGCLDREVSEEVNTFIQSIATMFLTGHQLMVYANLHKLLRTRPWRDHVQSWDKIYDFAAEHINQRIDEVTKELECGVPPVEGEHVDFLKYIVGTHQLSRNEIVDNIIEVFMGGIDTTANSLAFLFYLLSKNEAVQTRLVAEIDNLLGKRQAESSDLQHMPFLKACVKETLRLFPPIPMNARTTTEDISVGGYHIPKDTILILNLYVVSRDEKIFSDPDEFRPDRWLRGGEADEEKTPHPFSLIPFGFGSRSCVGRRLAEMQIYLATIQILQRFWMKKSDQFDIKPLVRTQLTPGPELPVMFVER